MEPDFYRFLFNELYVINHHIYGKYVVEKELKDHISPNDFISPFS